MYDKLFEKYDALLDEYEEALEQGNTQKAERLIDEIKSIKNEIDTEFF